MAASTSSRASSVSDVLNIRGTPAIVEWHDATSQSPSKCYLAQSSDPSPIQLSLFFDTLSNTAFFKLRVAVMLEDPISQGQIKTYLYILIHPEQVLSLVQEEVEKLPQGAVSPAARLSSSKAMCLRFVLSKPASVVAPVNVHVRPASTSETKLLESLERLLQQNTFAIYIALDALPNSKRLQSLCRASGHCSLKSHPKHADLSGLYGGRGGRVVDVLTGYAGSDKGKERQQGGDTADEDSAPLEIPPSYSDIAPSPLSTASAPPQPFPKKRRRVSLESAAPETNQMNMLDICGKLLARQQAEMQKEMFAHMDKRLQQMEDRLLERLDDRLDERLECLKSDICTQVEERMDTRIDEVTVNVDALIDERIDDSVLGIKMDLESYVKDEVRNVQDDIRDDLQEGSFTIQFNRE